jgi:hypothetical protein
MILGQFWNPKIRISHFEPPNRSEIKGKSKQTTKIGKFFLLAA